MKLIMKAVVAILLVTIAAAADKPKAGVLSATDIKRFAPSSFFFDGQSATVQLRNTAGFSTENGKLVLAGLVDVSGYASDVQAKYQGFFITEVKVNIEGSELGPGEYGFGFAKDGKFMVMDVAAHDLFTVAGHMDDKLAHPVPLKVTAEGDGFHLYAGRKWVAIKAE